MEILRQTHLDEIEALLDRHPVVGLLGARQVGKTTLARQLAARLGSTTGFDLENPEDLARLSDPMLTLKGLRGLVILDEIQLRADLFPVLRVLADRPGPPARFLVLGSASPALVQQSSESLAGRIHYHELPGFSLREVGPEAGERLWRRGGFPRAFLAADELASAEWRRDFIRTFLERDLPQLGIRIPAQTLRRFWTMVAHYHGQVWNGAELARAFGVGHTTVRRYLDLLTAALVLRQLPPWHENIGKRQVRSPKVYLTDSGLLHTLLGFETQSTLESHPKVGASWEGFVIQEIVQQLDLRWDQCFFWATHAGAELDLLIVRGQERMGFEVKRTVSPKVTPSMRSALDTLKLSQLCLIHAGDHSYPLADGIDAIAFGRIQKDLAE